ncbi:hypothetical protein MKX01_006585 [Papaver californicum]|nr:hypothetical protein MKX01_006585 [Papaver californicum]
MSLCSSLSLLFMFVFFLQPRSVQSSQKYHPKHINNGRISLGSPISSLVLPSDPSSPSILASSDSPNSTPSPSPSEHSNSPPVPALFVFGDSSVDCGTNNLLGTFARADLVPYGRDFDTHTPTGRFCNGRIVVDYLGQDGSVEDMIHGVNYASASAGIIFSSGSELGQHISLAQQIQQAMDTFQQFTSALGEEQANAIISKSIFYLSIGSNDFIHYYLRNVSRVQSLYFPWGFNQLLVSIVIQELKNGWIMYLAPEMACDDAATHLWWDQFHPTDAVNEILAANIWSDKHMKMCFPMNLQDMI